MALARRGFNVTASDGSASMVAEARRRCTQFGVDDFSAPCRAEIVLLFEDASSAIAHRRYVIDFTPFTRAALTDAIHAVGLTVIGDSYQPDNPFYAVAAAMR
jgi:ubiquinone/menaquinone biosynthesis C-methylase UbiE